MRPTLILIFLIALISACSKNTTKADVEKNPLSDTSNISFQANWIPRDTMSIYHYMDTIAYYTTDSNRVLQLAKKDADKNVYFFMEFGMRAFPQMDEADYKKGVADQKAICSKYNIWIMDMGCEDSETGRIYTREMKRFLKQKEGIDYDSVFSPLLVTL